MFFSVQAEMSKHMLAALAKFSYLDEFETNRVIDARSTQQNQQKKTPQKIIAFVYQCQNRVHFLSSSMFSLRFRLFCKSGIE